MLAKPQLWLHSSTHRTMVAHPIMVAVVTSVNFPSHGHHSPRGHHSSNRGGLLPTPQYDRAPQGHHPICQIYEKRGHIAIDCYNRMNHAYQSHQSPKKLAAMVDVPFTHPAIGYSKTGAHNLHITMPYDGPYIVQVETAKDYPFNTLVHPSSLLFPFLPLN
ncbi:hypothetical protein NE237_006830 [Protea cynaroides]|uniref:Uncharacterized protein n=1 Tax=Protea cynaroides TaxID=273540 RepID=A0A9Q0KNZ9_9MAGN|nr:hypothetical protein NE237_006830 [Protea cynaroides]